VLGSENTSWRLDAPWDSRSRTKAQIQTKSDTACSTFSWHSKDACRLNPAAYAFWPCKSIHGPEVIAVIISGVCGEDVVGVLWEDGLPPYSLGACEPAALTSRQVFAGVISCQRFAIVHMPVGVVIPWRPCPVRVPFQGSHFRRLLLLIHDDGSNETWWCDYLYGLLNGGGYVGRLIISLAQHNSTTVVVTCVAYNLPGHTELSCTVDATKMLHLRSTRLLCDCDSPPGQAVVALAVHRPCFTSDTSVPCSTKIPDEDQTTSNFGVPLSDDGGTNGRGRDRRRTSCHANIYT